MSLQEGTGNIPQQAFERWNDPYGNQLIALNRDGTISCLGIVLEDIDTSGVNTEDITFPNGSVQTTAWLGTDYVISFNNRSGVILPQTNDYSFNQISGSLGLGQIPVDGTDQTYLRGDGSWSVPLRMVTTQSGNYNPLEIDETIFCNGTGPQIITLPTDDGIYVGKRYTIKLTGTGPVTVLTFSSELNGVLSLDVPPGSSSAGSAVTVQWDGSEYWMLSAL